jgi:hypothetical protein
MFSSQEIVRAFLCQSLLVFPPIFDLEIAWGTTKEAPSTPAFIPSTHVEKTGDESGAKVGKKF